MSTTDIIETWPPSIQNLLKDQIPIAIRKLVRISLRNGGARDHACNLLYLIGELMTESEQFDDDENQDWYDWAGVIASARKMLSSKRENIQEFGYQLVFGFIDECCRQKAFYGDATTLLERFDFVNDSSLMEVAPRESNGINPWCQCDVCQAPLNDATALLDWETGGTRCRNCVPADETDTPNTNHPE